MADGYMGRLLFVDLTRRESRAVPLPQWLKDDFVGGKGFGARLLMDLTHPGVDALGPDNPLMFLAGPLTATAGPSMRACVVCKSPLTGAFLDSYFGGRLGPEIRYAGYDGIVITGRSEGPVYLAIRDDRVEFRDAAPMWGTDALTANERIKADLNAPEACVGTIGQAGENGVLFALISCEYNRQAGRGGAGAVMGAKNLKGLAVQGSRLVQVHDLQGFGQAAIAATGEIAASAGCQALTDTGTSYAVPWSSAVGTLPVRNHSRQVYAHADDLGDPGQKKHLFLGKAACLGCPIRCSQMGAVRTGKYKHLITDIVEYESAAMIGSNLDIRDIRAVAHLVKRCDTFGMDSISAGAVIAFAFEAAQNGLIAGPAGIPLTFGSIAGADHLIETMALAQGELGRLLGQGVKRAAAALGAGSDGYALHVKGMEIPGWAVRGLPGMGLAYMTADRGACHQRGFMVAYEVGGEHFDGKPVEAHTVAGKAMILKQAQDYLSGLDCLVKCDFGTFGISAESYARMFNAATGRTVAAGFWRELGERVWNLVRLFNLREGVRAVDDRLPRRLTDEPLSGGPHDGQRIRNADVAYLRQDYYRARGWDDAGHPTPETLERLGLDAAERFDPNAADISSG